MYADSIYKTVRLCWVYRWRCGWNLEEAPVWHAKGVAPAQQFDIGQPRTNPKRSSKRNP